MKINTVVKFVLFCLALVVIRIAYTHHFSFLFLFWNLFLAWLPYQLIRQYRTEQDKVEQYGLISLTILFLPNAPYILTDLFHLHKNLLAPMWFDLVLISGFSLLGLFFFLLTVHQLLNVVRPMFRSKMQFTCFKLAVFLSNGYGIYLGRYLRFNSWDVLSHPDYLAKRMFISVFDSNNCKETLAITITFSIFLYLVFGIYESFHKQVAQQGHEFP